MGTRRTENSEKEKSNQDTQQKLNHLMNEMDDLNADMDNLRQEVQEIRKKVSIPLDKLGLDDIFQQFVGAVGFVFPLIFTDEIWKLAESISVGRAAFLIFLTLLIGYIFIGRSKLGNLAQQNLIGIPIRLITVSLIAYGSTFIIIYIYGLQSYYHLNAEMYFKALAIFGNFSVIGAIAVDMLG